MKHLIEFKWTVFYSILSLVCTAICIWINKEWYWIWLLNHLHLDNYTIMVTNMLEGLICYLRMSIYIAIYLGFISYSLLILIYFRGGQYKHEINKVYHFYSLFIIWNIWVIPLLFGLLSNTLWDSLNEVNSNILVMGKMSELLDTIRNVYILIWILFILYCSLEFKKIRELYIQFRKSILLIIYIIIGMISPPDIVFTLIVFIPIIILLEIGIFRNIEIKSK